MKLIVRLIGLGLLLVGTYFLGKNIYFSTNPYPYWWRGVAADGSILSLTIGVLLFFILPRSNKDLSILAIAIGILLIFASSKATLKPTSLWQFVISLASFIGGYQLFVNGRLNI